MRRCRKVVLSTVGKRELCVVVDGYCRDKGLGIFCMPRSRRSLAKNTRPTELISLLFARCSAVFLGEREPSTARQGKAFSFCGERMGLVRGLSGITVHISFAYSKINSANKITGAAHRPGYDLSETTQAMAILSGDVNWGEQSRPRPTFT